MAKKLLLLCFIVSLFSSCSWIERFCIYNLTNKPVLIEYSFYQNARGFPLFDNPIVHPIVNGEMNREKTIFINYKENYKYDTIKEVANVKCKFHLAPNCAVIIGDLNNSKYERVDQDFINDRYFNLSELKLYTEKEEVTVTKSNFDSYFKRVRGNIIYKLK